MVTEGDEGEKKGTNPAWPSGSWDLSHSDVLSECGGWDPLFQSPPLSHLHITSHPSISSTPLIITNPINISFIPLLKLLNVFEN